MSDTPSKRTFDRAALTCNACGAEYPASFLGDQCLECDGRLQRPDGTLVEVQSDDGEPGNDDEQDGWFAYLPKVAYLGGHPRWPDPVQRGSAGLDLDGFAIWASFGRLVLEVDADEIVSLEVDGPTEVQKRVTVPRVLALGLFALAVPKRERLAYLVATLSDGEVILEVRSMDAMELRAFIQPFNANHETRANDRLPAPRSVRERLLELNALRDEELISDAEYEARRQSILSDI